ncbi:MAG: hypothetical protein RSG77_14915 [Hafnia sp.]
MAIGRSDFTPVQDYTILNAKKALVMLQEYVDFGTDDQMRRAALAHRWLSSHMNALREKRFDNVAEVQFKSSLNTVMRYAESILGINLSKFTIVLGNEFRQFSDSDIAKARMLLVDALDDVFSRQSMILQRDELNEYDHECLASIECKLSKVLSASSQLERAVVSQGQPSFSDFDKFQRSNALENALQRIDRMFRTEEKHIGLI